MKVKYRYYILLLILFLSMSSFSALESPKREFRGAWIQCVNGQFQGLSTQAMKDNLTFQLDELQKDGINVVIFQVRPECDALYDSSYEPWSRFLTGVQGVRPFPLWDPLEWMITECHKRKMELHAWINPYRAKTKGTIELASTHIAMVKPNNVFEYDNLFILNPALKENRTYICKVAKDIVSRYDIDGLHIDDYFYPYPVSGLEIPDKQYFYADRRGFSNIHDWRRDNVNLFIKELGETIHNTKPWVKFGVSPFGIYRNKKEDADGSNTNGLTNYDGLYADVLKWIREGWIDYNVPQVYWQIGHPAADYKELVTWWNGHAGKRTLVIGEDVERTVKHADPSNPDNHQQYTKMELTRSLPNVAGTCLWYSRTVVDNVGKYGSQLQYIYFRYRTLQPSMPWLSKKAPKSPKKLEVVWMENDGLVLFWTAPKATNDWATKATEYVVYRFAKGEKINTEDINHIVAITTNTFLKLPYKDGKEKFTYVVTALNRIHNESKSAKKKVRY